MQHGSANNMLDFIVLVFTSQAIVLSCSHDYFSPVTLPHCSDNVAKLKSELRLNEHKRKTRSLDDVLLKKTNKSSRINTAYGVLGFGLRKWRNSRLFQKTAMPRRLSESTNIKNHTKLIRPDIARTQFREARRFWVKTVIRRCAVHLHPSRRL